MISSKLTLLFEAALASKFLFFVPFFFSNLLVAFDDAGAATLSNGIFELFDTKLHNLNQTCEAAGFYALASNFRDG